MNYEDYLNEHYSPRSVKGYLRLIQRLKRYLADGLNGASYMEIVEYLGKLRSEGLHPKTLRNHLFGIKIYYTYLLKRGIRKDHPCASLQLKDRLNRSVLIESLYTKESLELLYKNYEQVIDQERSIYHRNKLLLSVLIYQALTTLEIVDLRVEDIDLEEGTMYIRGNEAGGRRGNRSRTLGLQSKQVLLINIYLTEDRKSLLSNQENPEYFFLNTKGAQLWLTYLNRFLKDLKVNGKSFTPLKIRQSVIANLLKEKNDVRIVQEFAGHRRTGSTEAYKQSGLEALQLSIELYHPRQ